MQLCLGECPGVVGDEEDAPGGAPICRLREQARVAINIPRGPPALPCLDGEPPPLRVEFLLEVLVPALRHAEPLVPASRERVVSQQLAGWCTENRKRHVHTRLTCTGRWPCRPSGGGRACRRARPRCRSCLCRR